MTACWRFAVDPQNPGICLRCGERNYLHVPMPNEGVPVDVALDAPSGFKVNGAQRFTPVPIVYGKRHAPDCCCRDCKPEQWRARRPPADPGWDFIR